jgi:hypothetical protein
MNGLLIISLIKISQICGFTSFTNYSESLFCGILLWERSWFWIRKRNQENIQNDKPIIGHYNVNNEGSSDMYYKQYAAYFTTNCKWWWKMENYIKRFKQYFYHQTVTTKQIEDYLSSTVGIDLELFFHQYLRDTRVPTLEYYFKDSSLFVGSIVSKASICQLKFS